MHMSNKLSLVLIKDVPDIRAPMPHQKWPQQSRSNVRRYTNDPLRLYNKQRVVAELADANQQLKRDRQSKELSAVKYRIMELEVQMEQMP